MKNIIDKSQVIQKILHNLLLYLFFCVYVLILFAFLFLKITSFQSVNFIPFRTIFEYLSGDMLAQAFAPSNIIGNIVLFFPLGIYFTLFNPNKKLSINVAMVALVSIFVEIMQFLFKVGATDIDDVILNTLGGLIGVLIFKLLNKILKQKIQFAIEILAPITGICAVLILILSNM